MLGVGSDENQTQGFCACESDAPLTPEIVPSPSVLFPNVLFAAMPRHVAVTRVGILLQF